MYSASPQAFLTLVMACLLAGVFFLNHGAIRTVAADLNHDLAKLVNGKVAGQLRRKERQRRLQFTGCAHATHW
jgi:hypothetical protein